MVGSGQVVACSARRRCTQYMYCPSAPGAAGTTARAHDGVRPRRPGARAARRRAGLLAVARRTAGVGLLLAERAVVALPAGAMAIHASASISKAVDALGSAQPPRARVRLSSSLSALSDCISERMRSTWSSSLSSTAREPAGTAASSALNVPAGAGG